MLFKNISILNERFEVERNVNVGVEEREISYIGKEMPESDFGEIYDGSG